MFTLSRFKNGRAEALPIGLDCEETRAITPLLERRNRLAHLFGMDRYEGWDGLIHRLNLEAWREMASAAVEGSDVAPAEMAVAVMSTAADAPAAAAAAAMA